MTPAISIRPLPLMPLIAWMCLFVLSCTPNPKGDSLRVLAPVSLSNTLTEVALLWEAEGGIPLSFGFDGTSRLATQLNAGAPADVFFAADSAWMDELVKKEVVDGKTRQDILGNQLVVIVPRDASTSPRNLRELVDLPGPLALAGAAVPAGRYARGAFLSAGINVDDLPQVLNGDHVRAVLSWVAKGEVGAGIVYATDAILEDKVRVAFHLDPSSHHKIVYPAALVSHGTRPKEARDFVSFCQRRGRRIFEEAGFLMLSKETQ